MLTIASAVNLDDDRRQCVTLSTTFVYNMMGIMHHSLIKPCSFNASRFCCRTDERGFT